MLSSHKKEDEFTIHPPQAYQLLPASSVIPERGARLRVNLTACAFLLALISLNAGLLLADQAEQPEWVAQGLARAIGPFGSTHDQTSKSNQRPNTYSAVYVNPNLSPRSPRTGEPERSRKEGSKLAPGLISTRDNQMPAEWPFVKSLQTARNNFQANSQRQLYEVRQAQKGSEPGSVGELEGAHRGTVEAKNLSSSASTESPTSTASPSQLVTGLASLDQDVNGSSGKVTRPSESDTTSSSIGGDDEANTANYSLTSKPTSSANSTEPVTVDDIALQTSTQPTTSTTTTTTAATATAGTTPDPLFSPDFHASVQQAVNRIVKMTSDPKKAGESSVVDPQQEQQARSSTSSSTQLPGFKSSLSLNVLLKNFGVYNLTNLDQILLKSKLARNDTLSMSRQITSPTQLPLSPGAEQRISISGLQNVQRGGLISSGSESNVPTTSNADNGDSDEQMAAECRIEYTMKHVNISLLNGSGRDYTCDYIIDRKMSSNNLPPTNAKVCRLQLTSKFFSNELATNESKKEPESTCNGTYLAIDEMKFCYLRPSSATSEFTDSGSVIQPQASPGKKSLNRVFDFPIERDAFDIKMVHKQQAMSKQRTEAAAEQGEEIHLEIKPLFDDECRTRAGFDMEAATMGRPASETESSVEYRGEQVSSTGAASPSTAATPRPVSSAPSMATTRAGELASTRAPHSLASGRLTEPLQPRERASEFLNARHQHNVATITVLPNGPKRKFVIKLPQDKQLHPLNNRFKVSQSFDVTSTPRLYANNEQHQQAAVDLGGRFQKTPTVGHKSDPSNLPSGLLCDGSKHVSTLGQLTSPHYPDYYPANLTCSFIIKRSAPSYCHLLLHFRDFDLIDAPPPDPEMSPSTESAMGRAELIGGNCLGDFLVIGETRYCNKYAMIGHKMRLDFNESSQWSEHRQPFFVHQHHQPEIKLTFHSDHMRSGRGFLIKYQQLPCEESSLDSRGRSDNETPEELSGAAHSPGAANGNFSPGRQVAKAAGSQGAPTSTTLIGDLIGPVAREHTVAPPMQQPDFSLALKSTTPSRGAKGPTAGGTSEAKDKNQAASLFNEKSNTANVSNSNSKKSRSHKTSGAGAGAQPGISGLLSMASTVSSSSLSLGQPGVDFSTSPASTALPSSYSSGSQAVQGGQAVDCNQVNSERNFILTSFNYPSAYSNNLQCLYYVRRNTSQVCYLELTFLKFDLEADADCRYDYLEVNNVRLCGSLKDMEAHKTTRIYLFNEPLKVLKFKSDETGTKSGFLIRIDQLECASNGSIMRQSKASESSLAPATESREPDQSSVRLANGTRTNIDQEAFSSRQASFSSSANTSSTFEYDSLLTSSGPGPTTRERANNGLMANAGPQSAQRAASSAASSGKRPGSAETPHSLLPLEGSGEQAQAAPRARSFVAPNCDELLQGREVTIKSPLWPESYSNDESIGMCRYTIVRHTTGKNRICQLELRFVNLRLGVSDCIDIDGYEVLCGFNTRNMVKYYPFEHQSYLTVTFFTGAGKAVSARSLLAASDLLPTRLPLKFMILAKQHECVDGFLAPQFDGSAGYNHTNLLYASPPRYVNKTLPLPLAPITKPAASLLSPTSTGTGGSRKSSSTEWPRPVTGHKDTILQYDFSSASGKAKRPVAPSSGGLMYLSADNSSSLTTERAQQQTAAEERNSFVGSTASTARSWSASKQIISTCLDGRIVRANEHELFSADYPAGYRERSHCVIIINRKSQEFCHLELEILDVDLESTSKLCESDYIQVNHGERYCNLEQAEKRLGPKRIMLIPFERPNDNKATLVFHSELPARQDRARGFLLRHRQVECTPFGYLAPVESTGSGSGARSSQPTESEMKLIDRMPLAQIGARTRASQLVQLKAAGGAESDTAAGREEEKCVAHFGQYNGILSSTSVVAKSRSGRTGQLGPSVCEIHLRLLPGYCQVQLTFGEFELGTRFSGGQFCLDYLEMAGVQYCGDELKNSSHLVAITDSNQRTVDLRYVTNKFNAGSGPPAFRAVFKQIECLPEPLRPLGGNSGRGGGLDAVDKPVAQDDRPVAPPGGRPRETQSEDQSTSLGATKPQLGASVERPEQQQHVEFKEIVLRGEFFELNSFKLSSKTRADTYEANMFVVYRIKKMSPDVCKLRLMFYRFDLEPSIGCKRDFLDINNVDRLCGQLGKPEDTRRDYSWPSGERDFLVSFVSDASLQREGFLLFGQQLTGQGPNCSASAAAQPIAQGAQFDEEQPTKVTTAAPPGATPSTPVRRINEAASSKQQRPQGETNKQDESRQQGASSSGDSQLPPPDSCHKLYYETKFELASPNWPQRYAGRASCFYLIHKAQADVCSVTFNVISMILGHYEPPSEQESCDTSRRDHLDFDGQILCGTMSKPRAMNVEFGRRQFISVKFSSLNTGGFGFFIEAKQNKCNATTASDDIAPPTKTPANLSAEKAPHEGGVNSHEGSPSQLAPKAHEEQGATQASGNGQAQPSSGADCSRLLVDEVNVIESENFPQHYKHNQDCLYAVRRSNQSVCAVDIIMNHFDLEPESNSSGICETDYLEVDYSRFCGLYPAHHRLRFNYFDEELDKLLKFHSDAANSRSGFSVTIRQASDCDESGATIGATSGGRAEESENDNNNNNNYPAGSNDGEIINYLPTDTSTSAPLFNLSANEQVSKEKNNRSLGERLDVSTLCQFTHQKERQYLVSPNYNELRHTYDNNMDCLYKVLAKSYEFCSLRLVLIDLDLEESSDCHNDYLLIDNQRYCGRTRGGDLGSALSHRFSGNSSSGRHVIELPFPEALPREIHLLYHTNAHLNKGRGFKLLYEQLACDPGEPSYPAQGGKSRAASPAASRSTGPDERQARRLHFGQLSYPKNYVSSPGHSWLAAKRGGSTAGGEPEQQVQAEQRLAESTASLALQSRWRDTRPQLLAAQAAATVAPRAQGAQKERSSSMSMARQQEDLARASDEQHEDLTLSKEIVVVKSSSSAGRG